MQKSFLLSLICFVILESANPQAIDFSTIPKSGTILVYTHQDDDLIWMLPFWNITEKFIGAAMPATPGFLNVVHNQQIYMDNNGYNIPYESNWFHPWGMVTDAEYVNYYWNNDVNYWYLEKDHVRAFWNASNTDLVRREINKIKAKIEQYIADPGVTRIITHNNWGEYGHNQHKAVNAAVRELAVKYGKDVWMLGVDNNAFIDVPIPPGFTYTMGNFNGPLFSAIRNIYLSPQNWWTWSTYTPTGNHLFIKVVEAGIDKSNLLTGETVAVKGPNQLESGSYIFDGIDDYMTLAGNNNASFTIAMRIRPDEIKSMDISKMTEYPLSTTFDHSFYMQGDGRITARIFDGQSRTVTSSSALSAGNWAHILMTGDGSRLKIYINGVLEGDINAGPAISNYTSPEFLLGQAQETASFFKGQISDVRLYNFAMPDSTISSLFNTNAPQSFTLTSSAGTGGTISPSGTATVNQGGSKTYVISPGNGFKISDVRVDNVSVGPSASYTFSNVSASHTITASFENLSASVALFKPTFCQSFQSGSESSKANDDDGTNNSFWAASPYPQWWMVDLGNNYDLTSVMIRNYVDGTRYYQYSIQASTDNLTYTTIAEKTNANVAPDAGDTYNINTTARYLKVLMNYNSANGGVHITDFKAFGTPSSIPGTYQITASAGIGCTISPAGNVTVVQGDAKTFTITANSGYQIASVLVDNVSVGAVTSYTFSNVTADHTIAAMTLSASVPTYGIDYYSELTNKIVPATDEYSYHFDMSGAVNGNGQKLALSPGKDVYFRTKAGNGLMASDIQHLVVPVRPAVPSFSIDYFNEKSFETMGPNLEYSTSPSYTSPVTGNGSRINLTPGQDLYIWVKATSSSFYSLVNHLAVPARPPAPLVSIDFVNEKSAESISSSVEYSTAESYANPVSGKDSKIDLNPGQDLYFWVKATNNSFYSMVTHLAVPGRPSVPSITIDYPNEKTSTITPAVEWAENSVMTSATDGLNEPLKVTPGSDLYFRVKHTAVSFSSDVQTLHVPDRPARPSVSIDFENEGTAENIDPAIEYSVSDSYADAVSGVGSKVRLSPGQDLYFWVKSTSNSFFSTVTHLVVPIRPETPSVEIDFSNEITSVIPSTVEYTTDQSLEGFTLGGDSAVSVTPGDNIYLREKATTNAFASDIQTLIIPKRPDTPKYKVNYREAKTREIVLSTDEYSANPDMSDAVIGPEQEAELLPGVDMYFRIRATDTSFYSLIQHLIVKQRPSPPEFHIDYVHEELLEAVDSSVMYSYSPDFDSAITGNDAPLPVIPGETLYFMLTCTDSAYSSTYFQLDVPRRPVLVSSVEDTLILGMYTVQAILDESITDFDLSDISVTNGQARNLRSGNLFDVIPENRGIVQVIIPPNSFGNSSFGSNTLVAYFRGLETGLKEFGKNEMTVYPVPSNTGKVNVYVSIPGKYKIELFSSQGELIREIMMNDSGLQSIDLSDYKGIYYLRITSGEIRGIRKIILY